MGLLSSIIPGGGGNQSTVNTPITTQTTTSDATTGSYNNQDTNTLEPGTVTGGNNSVNTESGSNNSSSINPSFTLGNGGTVSLSLGSAERDSATGANAAAANSQAGEFAIPTIPAGYSASGLGPQLGASGLPGTTPLSSNAKLIIGGIVGVVVLALILWKTK